MDWANSQVVVVVVDRGKVKNEEPERLASSGVRLR